MKNLAFLFKKFIFIPMDWDFRRKLTEIWNTGVELYQNGHRVPKSFPLDDDMPFLSSCGINKMDVFDFTEDWTLEKAPKLETFLSIHELRRDYFWEVQKKIPSTKVLDPSTLPSKAQSIRGIPWLPRLIFKARAKLKGELDPSTMFCCGGDRSFFRKFHIHPTEFLRVVMQNEDKDEAIVSWVLNQKKGESSLFYDL